MRQNSIPQTKDTQKPSFRPVPRKDEGYATRHGRHAEEDEFGRRDSVAACNKPDSGYHSCVGTGGHPRKVAADRQHNNGGYCESYGSICGGAHTELACLASKSLLLMTDLPSILSTASENIQQLRTSAELPVLLVCPLQITLQ